MEFPSNSEVAGIIALAIVAILFALKALEIRLRYVLLPAAAIAMAMKGFGSTGSLPTPNHSMEIGVSLFLVALVIVITFMMRFFPKTASIVFGFFRF